jgi:hypothetical protein
MKCSGILACENFEAMLRDLSSFSSKLSALWVQGFWIFFFPATAFLEPAYRLLGFGYLAWGIEVLAE